MKNSPYKSTIMPIRQVHGRLLTTTLSKIREVNDQHVKVPRLHKGIKKSINEKVLYLSFDGKTKTAASHSFPTYQTPSPSTNSTT